LLTRRSLTIYPPEQSLYDEYELPLLLLVQIGTV
jgi:hypothetical protein